MFFQSNPTRTTRRELFAKAGSGVGSIALASLLADSGFSVDENPNPLQAASPKAKNVIFLHMVGAPSHLDLFDYKKSLQDHDGELCPDKYLAGQRFAFLRGHPKLLGTRFQFKKFGKSGQQFSELLPHLSSVGDEICLIKTLHTTQFNHAPAQLFFQTGFERFGRPTLGSWLSYGLGSENQDLPAFVVLITGSVAGAGNSLWGSGFLPTEHQGVEFRSKGDPVLFLSNPKGVDRSDRRQVVDGINFLNSQRLMDVGDPEISTRIKQYELAFRMQASVPELMDISQETKQTHQMYGTTPGKSSFANNCLLARRLVERGVRYVQLFDQGWDHHGGLFKSLPAKAKQVDRPIAALIQDLKQRGLLEETLVVWGSEFGRTPMQQSNATVGRDHHKDAFTVWMAGGGVKGGMTFGQTDELGYFPVENPVEVHDFHATLLHLLGLDHQKLTFRYQGRKFRLTDVAGNVITDIVDS
ncbi:DUF1501 domain-containing protein [Mariniblastus sp.]|nr:DUF1501 domain-containing protein [Mariniblastus sp.]MDB4755972.1 DUF1501 domain-containing protein [Mariniblastus sp.]